MHQEGEGALILPKLGTFSLPLNKTWKPNAFYRVSQNPQGPADFTASHPQ